jgi:hypothetical protein
MRGKDLFTIILTILSIIGVVVIYFFIVQEVIIPAQSRATFEKLNYK